jgi:Tol biopolymer transport system component
LLSLALLAFPFHAAGADSRTSQIVFSSNRSGAWRLWTIQADGSELKQLTKQDGDEHDVDPVFSSDGKSILFTSTRGGRAGVWRMPVNGSGSTGYQPVPSGDSPDGTATTLRTNQGKASAGVPPPIPVGGSPTGAGESPAPPTPQTAAERICDGDQAEWSPDGAKIVFRRNERLFTRELTGGKEKGLTPEDWPHCSGPAWSPDGKSIAFAARWDAGNAIYLVPAEGGKPVKVYDKQGACEPHWSPDGARLVYETETHICTINPDGTKNRLITYFGGVQRYARFSPDGKWLVFCQGVTEQGPWELYVIPATGGTPQKLTEGSSNMYPDWR